MSKHLEGRARVVGTAPKSNVPKVKGCIGVMEVPQILDRGWRGSNSVVGTINTTNEVNATSTTSTVSTVSTVNAIGYHLWGARCGYVARGELVGAEPRVD